MRHSQAQDWAAPRDICDQREPGTESRAGAFIPNIETSLIKYCSQPGSPPGPWHGMLSQLARWWWWWHAPVLASVTAAGIRVCLKRRWGDIYNTSCDNTIKYISWEGRPSVVKTWQSDPSEMTWDNESWLWAEEHSGHYKVISVQGSRMLEIVPVSEREKAQMRKTWE